MRQSWARRRTADGVGRSAASFARRDRALQLRATDRRRKIAPTAHQRYGDIVARRVSEKELQGLCYFNVAENDINRS